MKLKDPQGLLQEQRNELQQERIKRLWPVPSHLANSTSPEPEQTASPIIDSPAIISGAGRDKVEKEEEQEEEEEEEEKIRELYPYLFEGAMTVDSHVLHEKMQNFHRMSVLG